jgi:hypothetical protein
MDKYKKDLEKAKTEAEKTASKAAVADAAVESHFSCSKVCVHTHTHTHTHMRGAKCFKMLCVYAF